jgi:CheY-like chemotaxis protein
LANPQRTKRDRSTGARRAPAAVFEGAAFSVVILDSAMPEMDGLALARTIKADPAICAARLIVLSPRGKRLTEEEKKSAGIEHVCYKPVRQSALYDALANVPAATREIQSSHVQRRK